MPMPTSLPNQSPTMPPNVDMSVIREALQRRADEGSPAGGATAPAIEQKTIPTAQTPGGGVNTPSAPPIISAGAKSTTPLDDHTKLIIKTLMKRFLELV